MERAVFYTAFKNKRFSKYLLRDGYYFKLSKKTANKGYWICISSKCKATVALDINDCFVLSSNGVRHNHPIDTTNVKIRKFYEIIRQNVLDNPTSTIPHIYRETLTDMFEAPEKVPSYVPKFDGIRTFMYRVRASTQPKETDGSKSVRTECKKTDSQTVEGEVETLMNWMLKNQEDGVPKKKRECTRTDILVEKLLNKYDASFNASNEQDNNSSDSINKGETENRSATAGLRKQQAATSSSVSDAETSNEPESKLEPEPTLELECTTGPEYELEPDPTFESELTLDPESTSEPSKAEEPLYELKDKRRFVNVAFFVKSMKDLNNHGGDGCNLSDMDISGETKNGWNAGIKLSCKVCLTTVIVWMDDPSEKVVISQPDVPPNTTATTKEKLQPTTEENPKKKRKKNNQQETPKPPADPTVQSETLLPPSNPPVQSGTSLPPSNPLVQSEISVPPTDLTVQSQTTIPSKDPIFQLQAMVLPYNPLNQLQSVMPPALSRPQKPQWYGPSMQPRQQNSVNSINPLVMVPPQMVNPYVPQSISTDQNRMHFQYHSSNSQFIAPIQLFNVPNIPHQDLRHNSHHSINQYYAMPGQLTRPFMPPPQPQNWVYNQSQSSSTPIMSESFPQPNIRHRSFTGPNIMPQPNSVHQDETVNSDQSSNDISIKQELLSFEDADDSSTNQKPLSAAQSVSLQLLFNAEPSESLETLPRSDNESETIVPELVPSEVLPVDLNLVKEEIEDESHSMEVNSIPSVQLVPHSVKSLNLSGSETL